MAENQVYLIKSGQNSFVEETEAIIGISGGRLGVGTTTPEADLHVTGSVKIGGDLAVDGTFTTINSNTISVDDKNIELGSTDNPTDVTADGGGITVKGTTDKTFNWLDATDAWTSSEHLYLANGKHFSADELRALDSDGLKLVDQTTSGVLIKGGKVGIHKTTPVYDLDVDGSGNFTSLYVDGNAVLTGEGSIFGKWEDGVTQGEIFYTGGNVGVGTNNPEYPLHVFGNAAVDGNFIVNGASGNLNVSNFNVSGDSIVLNYLGDTLASNRGGLIVKDSSNASKSLEYVESSNFWLSSESIQINAGKELQTDKVRAIGAGGLSLQDDAGNGIFVEDGGQVGINTTSPGYNLHVNGSTHVGGEFSVGNEFKISAGGAVGGTAPASDGDIIKWDDANNKWVAGANVGGGGGGGVGEVPLATINSLPSGQSIYQIDFAETYNVEPRIATQLEIDGDGSIIPYIVSGVSTSGYHLIFAQDIPNNNYRIHTTFGGRDVHWETGSSASLYYNDGDVSIQRNFTIGGNLTVNGTTTTVNTETVEIEDHNLVIAANTGYNQLTNQYPGAGGAYAGILWGTGDAGAASPVKLTYQTNKGFAFEGGNVGIGTTTPLGKLSIEGSEASDYKTHIVFNNTGGSKDFAIGAGVHGLTNAGFAIIDKSDDSALLYISDAGNVGIGTTNPSEKLEVAGTIKFGDGHTIGNGGGDNLHITSSSGENIIIQASGGINAFWGESSEQMRITSAGNVGIGTTDPYKKLTVGSSDADSWITAGGINTNLTLSSVGVSGGITFRTGGNNSDPDTTSTKMRITSGGNVGIGTTNPGAKLEIQGTSANSEYLRVGGANASANRALRFSSFNSGADDSGHIINAPSSGGVIQFQTSSANVMRIDSDGNVGIGTTNPTHHLNIVTSSGNSLKVENTLTTYGYGSPMVYFQQSGDISPNNSIGLFGVGNYDDSSELGNLFRITQSGNVGIGNTNPQNMLNIGENNGSGYGLTVNSPTLYGANIITTGDNTNNLSSPTLLVRHIHSDGTVNDILRATSGGNVGIGTTNPLGKLSIEGSGASDYKTHIVFNNTGGSKDFAIGAGIHGLTNAGFAIIDKSDDSALLYISDAGNVGIGTTNPSAALHVERSTGLAALRLQSGDADQKIQFNDGAGILFSMGVDVSEQNLFVFSTSSISNALSIKQNGNVGIGTTNPREMLDIDGQIVGGFAAFSFNPANTTLSGTISITAGTNTVTGTGTLFRQELSTRNTIIIDGVEYETSAISSDTSMTLTSNHIAGVVDASFSVVQNDWNYIAQARPGMGKYILLDSAKNGPLEGVGSDYFYSLGFQYLSTNAQGNLTQIAIPYRGNEKYMRYRYNGNWSAWTQII